MNAEGWVCQCPSKCYLANIRQPNNAKCEYWLNGFSALRDQMVASKLSISRGEQRPGPRGNARLLSLVTRVLHQGATSSPGRFSKAWDKRPGDEVDQGFKQQRQRRLQKRLLKSEFALLQTLLFHLVQFVNCQQIFQELNPKGLYQSLREETQNRCPVCLHSPQNMKLGSFTSQSCNNGKEMYKKACCTC